MIQLLQAAPGAAPNPLIQFAPMIFIFVIFYFLLIAPMRKKQKKTQEMLAKLKKGDEVITGGGIFGRIAALDEERGFVDPADLRQHQGQGAARRDPASPASRRQLQTPQRLKAERTAGSYPAPVRRRRAAADNLTARRPLPVDSGVLFGGGSWPKSSAGGPADLRGRLGDRRLRLHRIPPRQKGMGDGSGQPDPQGCAEERDQARPRPAREASTSCSRSTPPTP